MSNVFRTQHEIHCRYDLKGSLYNRSTPATADHTVARKDQDFLSKKQLLRIPAEKKARLLAQIDKDAQFFAINNVIDYSLLLGIHNVPMQGSQVLERADD